MINKLHVSCIHIIQKYCNFSFLIKPYSLFIYCINNNNITFNFELYIYKILLRYFILNIKIPIFLLLMFEK